MSITEEQKKTLGSLTCERLSRNKENMWLVESFCNRFNDDIAQTLRNEAYEEDEANRIAYYVIKDEEKRILFFFSLKCGQLFDYSIEPRVLELFRKLGEELKGISDDDEISATEQRAIAEMFERIRSNKGISKDELGKLPQKKITVVKELEKEFNQNITRVGSTFSGIEIVHFCANTDTDGVWEALGFPQIRGAVIFWQFVVPVIQKMLDCVGCEYLFLFAADRSKAEKLVRYYENVLGFNRPEGLATAKPIYDFTCSFMCHEISLLARESKEFFDNFNPEEDAV